MVAEAYAACGAFGPVLAGLSTVVVAVFAAYLSAALRGQRQSLPAPWRRTLLPLADVAFGLGLLGSVVGFIRTFATTTGALRVDAVVDGLSIAYYTTAWGLVTGLFATGGAYVLDLLTDARVGEETS